MTLTKELGFKNYLVNEDWHEFDSVLGTLIENLEAGNTLNEGLIDSLSAKMKGGIEFIKEFAKLIGGKLLDVLKLFKNKILFNFFSKIKWSIDELAGLVKKGYKLWQDLHNTIAEFVASNKVVKWTKDKLDLLDKFLDKHPLLKKAGTLVVVGFLIYQWTQMISFTGDIEFDFDQSVLFAAIKGSYSLADLFATADGIKMLLFIATGVLTGLTFPWPGNAWVLFALSLIYTASKHKYPQLSKSIIKNVKKFKGIKT